VFFYRNTDVNARLTRDETGLRWTVARKNQLENTFKLFHALQDLLQGHQAVDDTHSYKP
jgi:hypothetical protein